MPVSRRRSLLAEHFARVCRDRASGVAIHALSERRVFTFGDLWRDVEAFHDALAAHVPPGSPIVLLAGNRPAFVPALLAGLEHRATIIPLDAGSTPSEASRWVKALGVRAAMAPVGARFDDAISRTTLPHDLVLNLFHDSSPRGTASHAAVFKVTSGSTGAPRAVACTEEHLIADGRHIIEAMGIGRADVNLGVIPMSHSYGFGNLVMPLVLQGSTLALRDAFVPDRFFDDIAQSGTTVVPGVPFMFEYLVQRPAGRPLPRSVRLAITAGASIHPDVVRSFKEVFGLKVHSFYGTSETGGIAYDDDETIEDPLPVGRAMPGTTITLRPVGDPADSELSTRVDSAVGRVHVRGPAVASHYAGPEDEAGSAFCDGGFLTGDLGRLSGDRLVLTGRVSEFVNVAGRKVHPGEVARVLAGMPEVSAALVVGVPCDARGEALVACIVPEGGRRLSETALRAYCSDRLSSYKIPRHYVFVNALPVDQRGKTDRRALDALLAEHVRPGTAV